MASTEAILVFISSREETCAGCGEELGRKAWITLERGLGKLCLSCSDLDHLVYLSAGNAALTRRAKKYSSLSAVVLKWSKARKRNERQGLLVEEAALDRAEEECLADEDARARRRERAADRRAALDQQFVDRFAVRVRELFPRCPSGVEQEIAEHACLKSSGRIGRTAEAKRFEENPVRLAVIAHIRHTATPYHELLAAGYDRLDARFKVQGAINRILAEWQE